MKNFVPLTPLEIAFLFYGGKQHITESKLSSLERCRETMIRYYSHGVTIKVIAGEQGVTPERIRQILAKGLRTVRVPRRRKVWRMLVAERLELRDSSLAHDTFGEQRLKIGI